MFILMMIGLVFGGLLIASLPGFIPFFNNPTFGFLFFLFGTVISMAGMGILIIRLKKTGAEYLVNPGRPGQPLWFYIYRDGEVKIVSSIRKGEGYLFSEELDSLIPDLKSYSLADHKVRFVPEGAAHAVDLDMIEYAQLMDRKHGFSNLREGRAFAFNILRRKKGESNE